MFYHRAFVSNVKCFRYDKLPPTLLNENVKRYQHGATANAMKISELPLNYVDWSDRKKASNRRSLTC